jgi:hypothetical protein
MAITTEHSSGITEENVAKIATLIQELKQEIASDNGSFPLNSVYISITLNAINDQIPELSIEKRYALI